MHTLTPELAASVDLDVARDRLTIQVLDATTLPEIEAATKALRSWIKAHPEDEGMSDAFEQLFILKEIAEEQEAERRNAGTHLM